MSEAEHPAPRRTPLRSAATHGPAPQHRPFWADATETFRLAVPLMAAQVSVVALGLIDTATFGALGTAALAGGGLGAALFAFINISCVGVLTAVGIQVAYASTANPGGLRDIVRGGVLVALLLGVAASVVAAVGAAPVLRALGQDRGTVASAALYLAFAAPAIIPNLVFTTLRGLTVGLGKPGPVTAITIAAVALKAAMNFAILLAVRHIAGADRVSTGLMLTGAANTATYGFVALALWVHCGRRFGEHLALPQRNTLASAELKETVRLGVPIGSTYGIEAGLFTGTALIVGRFGTVALAANAVALQCVSLTFMLAVGVSQAATVRVGRAKGAGAIGEARRVGRQALAIGLLIMSASAVLFAVFGRDIAALIVGRGAATRDVVNLAAQFLLVAACFQWFDGTQNIAMGALRGLKRTGATMLAAVVGYWVVGLPAAWMLSTAATLGPVGAWWGLALGLVTASAILVAKFETATTCR